MRGQQNAIQDLLKPLLDLAERSDYLIAGSIGEYLVGEDLFQIPRFAFLGPAGGGDPTRLGIFATIHGDEPEGAEALVEFLKFLERKPRLARGYHLYVYPVCNPAGLVAHAKKNNSGTDLSKEFWRGSSRPEVYYLERELGVLQFHGVISLHVINDLAAFHIRTRSEILTREVLHPVIRAAQKRFSASGSGSGGGIGLPEYFLASGEELDPVPFELQIGIPGHLPRLLQANWSIHLLNSFLDSYLRFLAISPNL